jgi:hypothetical protein
MLKSLSESTNLLYAQLLTQCLGDAVPKSRGLSFTSKTIRGTKQWYLQLVVGKQKKQFFIGPDSAELRKRIEKEKSLWLEAKQEIGQREKLVAMAIAGGANTVSADVARVLEILERAGVFLLGGTLVGSHAFSIYGNMLGVSWQQNSLRTHDIDLASNMDPQILLGIKNTRTDLRQTLLESNLGFFEVPALNRKAPSTSFSIRGKELSVDLLTPLHGKPISEPIEIPAFNTYAQPMRFLEYLLEDTQAAVVVAKSGILVNVPSPARFAIHKLVVSQRRVAAFQTKKQKDIHQAAQLIEWLISERPGDIEIAIDAAKKMPAKFVSALDQAIKKLPSDLQLGVKRGQSSF